MSGFQEHFLDKYFAYRHRYVDEVTARAPHRRPWAVTSEIARLAFMIFGNLLCALILGALTVAAFARAGGVGELPIVFLALALLPSIFALLAIRGIAVAFGQFSRLERPPGDAAKGSRG